MALPPRRNENEVWPGKAGTIGVLEVEPGLIEELPTEDPTKLPMD